MYQIKIITSVSIDGSQFAGVLFNFKRSIDTCVPAIKSVISKADYNDRRQMLLIPQEIKKKKTFFWFVQLAKLTDFDPTLFTHHEVEPSTNFQSICHLPWTSFALILLGGDSDPPWMVAHSYPKGSYSANSGETAKVNIVPESLRWVGSNDLTSILFK